MSQHVNQIKNHLSNAQQSCVPATSISCSPFYLLMLKAFALYILDLRGILGRFGASLGRLRSALGRLGASWGVLGASWGVLGRCCVVFGESWRRLGGVLGYFGSALGASWRRLGAVLEQSGVFLEASWNVLDASRAVSRAICLT